MNSKKFIKIPIDSNINFDALSEFLKNNKVSFNIISDSFYDIDRNCEQIKTYIEVEEGFQEELKVLIYFYKDNHDGSLNHNIDETFYGNMDDYISINNLMVDRTFDTVSDNNNERQKIRSIKELRNLSPAINIIDNISSNTNNTKLDEENSENELEDVFKDNIVTKNYEEDDKDPISEFFDSLEDSNIHEDSTKAELEYDDRIIAEYKKEKEQKLDDAPVKEISAKQKARIEKNVKKREKEALRLQKREEKRNRELARRQKAIDAKKGKKTSQKIEDKVSKNTKDNYDDIFKVEKEKEVKNLSGKVEVLIIIILFLLVFGMIYVVYKIL